MLATRRRDGLPLHFDVGDQELRGVGVHLTLGQLDMAGHVAAADSRGSQQSREDGACTQTTRGVHTVVLSLDIFLLLLSMSRKWCENIVLS